MILAIGIIALTMANQNEEVKNERKELEDKLCFSNQIVLAGSVWMYNIDHDQEELMRDLGIYLLIREGYLESDPTTLPRSHQCSYLFQGDLSVDGYIYCPIYGNYELKQIKSR